MLFKTSVASEQINQVLFFALKSMIYLSPTWTGFFSSYMNRAWNPRSLGKYIFSFAKNLKICQLLEEYSSKSCAKI